MWDSAFSFLLQRQEMPILPPSIADSLSWHLQVFSTQAIATSVHNARQSCDDRSSIKMLVPEVIEERMSRRTMSRRSSNQLVQQPFPPFLTLSWPSNPLVSKRTMTSTTTKGIWCNPAGPHWEYPHLWVSRLFASKPHQCPDGEPGPGSPRSGAGTC